MLCPNKATRSQIDDAKNCFPVIFSVFFLVLVAFAELHHPSLAL